MRTRCWVTLVALLSCLLTPAIWADEIVANPTTLFFGNGGELSYGVNAQNLTEIDFSVDLFDSNASCSSCEISLSFLPAEQDISYTFTVTPAGDPNLVTPVVTTGSISGSISSPATFLDPPFTGNIFSLELGSPDITLTDVTVTGSDSEGNNYPISLPTVPEPSSVILISTGITALATQFKKKKKAS